MMASSVTVIVKTSYLCNFSCDYCYEGRSSGGLMSIETAYNLVDTLASYSLRNNTPISFVWHGGEPLLLGVDFYQKIVDRQKSFGDGFQFQNYIQTNGDILNKNFAKFFVDNNFNVGVSLDGPQIIHDSQRRKKDGSSSFIRVLEGIHNMENYGRRPGIMSIFTKNTKRYIHEYYEFFASMNMSFRINPLLITGNMLNANSSDLFVTQEEYGDSLIHIYDQWISEKSHAFTIYPFDYIVRGLISGIPRSCSFIGKCHQYFKVDPEGNVRPCGKRDDEFILGNVKDNQFTEICQSDAMKKFEVARKSVENHCSGCEFYKICNGGCAISAQSFGGKLGDRDIYCDSYKRIFSHIRDSIYASMTQQPKLGEGHEHRN